MKCKLQMWARRALGNIGSFPVRAFSTSGGALLGSVFLTKEEKPYRVEYPKLALENGTQLSRKIVNEEDKTKLGLRLYQYQACFYSRLGVAQWGPSTSPKFITVLYEDHRAGALNGPPGPLHKLPPHRRKIPKKRDRGRVMLLGPS